MWCTEKSIANKIKENEPAELEKLVEKFYAEVETKYRHAMRARVIFFPTFVYSDIWRASVPQIPSNLR